MTNRIKRELAHGEDYRYEKSKDLGQPILPVGSPMDITYFIHRKRQVERVVETIETPSTAPHQRLGSKSGCKSKSVPHIKNSFWERAKLSHKQYLDVLSTPHLLSHGDDDIKKFKSKTTSNICSPRLLQMSCPTKRRILSTWQDYGDHLPTETLQRFHDMLHTDQNIDLKDARKYFKMRDRQRKKLAKKRRMKRRKKKSLHHAYWLRHQIEETSTAIMNFFSGEPKLELSYKQLLISDALLVLLAKVLKKNNPILRFSRSVFNRQLVRMVDKMAVWIDSVSKIVEIQSIEEDEEEQAAAQLSERGSSLGSSITMGSAGSGLEPGAGELDEGEGEEMEGEVWPVTSFDRLIQILAHASPSYLGGAVEDLENLTRNELLNKIKVLNKDYSGADTPGEILKKILMEWAMHNSPSQVDVRVMKKIEDVSELLAAMLAAEDVYGMMGTLPIQEGPGSVKGSAAIGASDIMSAMEFGEDGEPLPGTVTEVIAPDGSVQLGVVDDNGEVLPVQMTPSGNLIPTVYDKNGKVVNQLFDEDGKLLEVTFNRYGVPEPDTYNGPLFDDVKYAHELIYNEKGRIIPQCYDKDGNPIGAAYDENGNPIMFGPDGQPLSVPPGATTKMVNGKLVIVGPDGEEIGAEEEGTIAEGGEQIEDVEKELESRGEVGEDEMGMEGENLEEVEEEEEEEGETTETEEEEKKSGEEGEEEEEETSAAGSRESMITVIKGHKPKKIYEHSNDTVCCLSLKIWAVWLLEITHNAHNWTKWVSNIIGQIREFAAILRGEVLLPNGQKKVLFKDDWNKFVDGMNDDVIAWRQYCRHVNDLTNNIVQKFHGKKVHCCEKCLQDHLIKNVVTAHDTMRSLTEALNCAGYWQRCLDEIVRATTKLTEIKPSTAEFSSDEETGWSYSSSSDEGKDSRYCYTKRRKLTPSPTWKKIRDTPCSCPCKLKQLFPKEHHKSSDEPCGCVDTSKLHDPRVSCR
ncbi:uncharacterized protein LOC123682800 isoform X1 [Harmonia axyridis]|uniref:uncharacterized protein LOC123682800 isoform X1 n=1 Tax=Harmonia axyridis TaxID=115357 RepID=UPI001E274FEE|nr:uncharacterized protein LOC123682800 isoform X1 [Harmonia axyridis]